MRDVGFALHKVEGVLETLGDLLALDYPFRDSEEALILLKCDFENLKRDLILSLRATEKVRKNQTQIALKEISAKLPILGIIQRSSETCGPVEFHGPFLSLVRKFLPDAKVIIASDWVFSPYTYIYPDLFEDQDFVFVSIPFSESDNGLISPLAGHELGHNIWRKWNLGRVLVQDANAEVHRLASNEFQKILKEETKTGGGGIGSQLFEPSITDKAVIWALQQCEEMFCDLLGIALFRESFLHSFEYLLAPNDFPRSVPTYPSFKDRIAAQIECAEKWSVKVPEGYSNAFKSVDGTGSAASQMADLAAKALVSKAIELAFQVVSDAGLSDKPSESAILSIQKAFDNDCPPNQPDSLTALFVTAWDRQLKLIGSNIDLHEPKEYALYLRRLQHNNELLLKSLEILEVNDRLRLHALDIEGNTSCSMLQPSLV